jgi:hypothetical protein
VLLSLVRRRRAVVTVVSHSVTVCLTGIGRVGTVVIFLRDSVAIGVNEFVGSDVRAVAVRSGANGGGK